MKLKAKTFNRSLLAFSVSWALLSQTHGAQFQLGGIEASLDSQLSMGSSWRTESADNKLLSNTDGQASNSDDGNKNYGAGDAFSQIFKGSHALQFDYGNFGGLIRAKYWYDSALANNSVDYGHVGTADVGGVSGSAVSYNGNTKIDDSGFADLSKASGAALMDAFVYGAFELGDMPVDLRLGRQVVSWGESTFIPGGINAINPIDVNAFRRPGAEIKEALLPVSMAYTNLGLSESLSMEAFYQLEFEPHAIPGCGTYFSTNDYASPGCNNIIMQDGDLSLSRNADGVREASDDGQFGVAFRFVAEALGDTEFGLYHMNFHNRAPTVNGTKNTVPADFATTFVTGQVEQATQPLIDQMTSDLSNGVYIDGSAAHLQAQQTIQLTAAGAQQQALAAVPNVMAAQTAATSSYFLSYEEDIQLTGISFATNVGAIALSGEINHKTDLPIQINGPQLVTAIMGANMADDAAAAQDLANATNAQEQQAAQQALQAAAANNNEVDLAVFNAAAGAELGGYRLFDVSQAQVTAIAFIDQALAADRLTLVAEAGMTYVHGFEDSDLVTGIRFGRSDIFGHPAAGEDDGFMTETSWGYRTRLSADYSDVFAGINLTPTLSFSHDVKGYAPQPGGVFQEGQKTLGLSLSARYLETYTGAISFTQFMGGKYSTVSDRDFASISLGMQF